MSQTPHHTDATWRTGVVRTRRHLCSTPAGNRIANVYGIKPGAMVEFPATATTRRGAPPH